MLYTICLRIFTGTSFFLGQSIYFFDIVRIREVISLKSNKVLVVLVIILFFTTIVSVSYIGYDFFSQESESVEEQNNADEELDINSRLVQSLYGKVVLDDDTNYKYFMYENNDNYIVSDASSSSKLTLAYFNLKATDVRTLSSDISDLSSLSQTNTISGLDYSYVLDNEEFDNGVRSYYTVSFIPYDKMNNSYRDLFGDDAVIDKSIPIKTDYYNVRYYIYNETLDGYVPYITEGGGTSGSYFVGKVTKAIKSDGEILIYEFVEEVLLGDGIEVASPSTYVYTFQVEDDGYTFISRIKE